MRFECTVENLVEAASIAARFVQRGGTMPTLNSIYLETNGDSVVLRATNLEYGVEVVVPARVLSSGAAAISSATLIGFISNSHGHSIECTVDGGVMKLKTERTSATIKTTPHDDFPILPRIPAEHSFVVKAQDLAKGIRSVLNCASVSNVKPELQSVLVYGDVGKLYFVATDSFRLAEKQVALKSPGSVPNLLMPARNVSELVRILEGVKGDIEVYYNDNQFSIQIEGVYYTSRLLDGTYPNYTQIVPKSFTTEVVLLRDDLSQALKGLSVFNDKFLQVVFMVQPKEKTVHLSSRNADVGEEECVLKAAVSGEQITMTFNSKYLADGLTPLAGESVRIRLNGAGRPALIQDVADDSFFYLAMPMNR